MVFRHLIIPSPPKPSPLPLVFLLKWEMGLALWSTFGKSGHWKKDAWATFFANHILLRLKWQRSSVHTVAAPQKQRPPRRGSGSRAQSLEISGAGESAGLTGEIPAGRERAEQTQWRWEWEGGESKIDWRGRSVQHAVKKKKIQKQRGNKPIL